MSKVSFRAKALDASKPMPVLFANEVPDLSEYASIGRSVPQMPTGMEKEEEMTANADLNLHPLLEQRKRKHNTPKELHLQQAISAQQAISTGSVAEEGIDIPIPKVLSNVQYYSQFYSEDFKLAKHYVKTQASLSVEPELPDYDMDSEDLDFLESQKGIMEMSPLQFEKMMDRLEKASEHQVVNAEEAKLLLQEDDDLSIAVYDYWLAKRLKTKTPLIPCIRTEKRDGAPSGSNPYIAFRRRGEKIQTRKNRRNDEDSYEKMLKLRNDLNKAVTLLEMIKKREKSKRELINMSSDVFDRRFQMGDWSNAVYNQVVSDVRPAFAFTREEITLSRKLKRESRKRKSKSSAATASSDIVSPEWLRKNAEKWHKTGTFPGSSVALLEAASGGSQTDISESVCGTLDGTDLSEDVNQDGKFAFKRKHGCQYHAVTEPNHQAETEERCGLAHKSNYRYTPTYLHTKSGPLSYVGLVRRRIGRGGRVVFDRTSLPKDLSSSTSMKPVHTVSSQKIPYFRPTSPIDEEDMHQMASSQSPDGSGQSPDGVVTTTPGTSQLHPSVCSKVLMLSSQGSCVVPFRSGLDIRAFGTHEGQLGDWLKEQSNWLAFHQQAAATQTSSSPSSSYSCSSLGLLNSASEDGSGGGGHKCPLQSYKLSSVDSKEACKCVCTKQELLIRRRRGDQYPLHPQSPSSFPKSKQPDARTLLLTNGPGPSSSSSPSSSNPISHFWGTHHGGHGGSTNGMTMTGGSEHTGKCHGSSSSSCSVTSAPSSTTASSISKGLGSPPPAPCSATSGDPTRPLQQPQIPLSPKANLLTVSQQSSSPPQRLAAMTTAPWYQSSITCTSALSPRQRTAPSPHSNSLERVHFSSSGKALSSHDNISYPPPPPPMSNHSNLIVLKSPQGLIAAKKGAVNNEPLIGLESASNPGLPVNSGFTKNGDLNSYHGMEGSVGTATNNAKSVRKTTTPAFAGVT